MAIGERKPITFAAAAITEQQGGSFEENYTDLLSTFAKVKQKSSARNVGLDQLLLRTEYEFSEIRVGSNFTPDKTMVVKYRGLVLAIEAIILDESTVPYYYTIKATENA